jgi:hypothetical protein
VEKYYVGVLTGACGFKGKENLQVSQKKAETAAKKNRDLMREAKYL